MTRAPTNSLRIMAITFSIASLVFILVAVLGDAGASTTFLILGLAFAVVAANAWRGGRAGADGSES